MNADEPKRRLQRVGRYFLFDRFAGGAAADVHLGLVTSGGGFSRTVAVKRLREIYAHDADALAMFLDEARLSARIHHANVVATFDVVQTEHESFQVMEYVEGEALATLLDRSRDRGELPGAAVVARIVHDALHGLHAAHEARSAENRALAIVHRDVSPKNILVGVDGVSRVADFGVAKAAARIHVTKSGVVHGTLPYMSPEQLRGGFVDRRTDIYAAGVILWQAMTGHHPFEDDDLGVTHAKILDGAKGRPSDLVPTLSANLDAVVLRAMAGEARLRFPTAEAMALALERSVTLAPRQDVAAWIHEVASGSLTRRAELVAEMEAELGRHGPGLDATSPSHPGLPSSDHTSPPRRTRLAVALLAAVLVFAATAAHRVSGRFDSSAGHAHPDGSSSASLSESVDRRPETPLDLLAALPPAEAAGASASASASAPASFARPPPSTQAHSTLKPRPSPSCDPPFYYDGSGIKHYRVECGG